MTIPRKVPVSVYQLQRIVRLQENARQKRKEDRAHELDGSLVRNSYKGDCHHCGVMLTEQDRGRGRETYTCPSCGRSGKPVPSTPRVPPQKTTA